MSIGGITVAPIAVLTAGTTLLQPELLVIGLTVAVLSSAAPYALELRALRRLPQATFSVLLALAPAIAALTGSIVLQQHLALTAWTGIAAIVTASAGATLTSASRRVRQALDPKAC